jgi:hypothetical protein
MITDINGDPYTSATEDLRLRRIKDALQETLHEEIQRAILSVTRGDVRVIQIDARKVFHFYEIAYAMGRAREACTRPPTKLERGRLNRILDEALDRIAAQVRAALESTHEHRAALVLGPVLDLLDQAYYAGREDGA